MPKTKTPSAPAPAELLAANELSKCTQAALEQFGKKIGPAQLHRLFLAVEQNRGQFAAATIQFGIALLGVKENTPHGEFQNVLMGILDRGNAVSHLNSDDRHDACRELRSYMCLARKFLAGVESLDGRSAWACALKVDLTGSVPAGLVIAEHLLTIGEAKFATALDRFVAGRSLRQMLSDFREAAKDAELDELADEQRGHRRRQLTLEEKTAAQRKEAEQLYFDDLLPKVRESFLCDKPMFEHLPRADRQKLADSLHKAYERVKKSLAH
jgi:hypothetical protein